MVLLEDASCKGWRARLPLGVGRWKAQIVISLSKVKNVLPGMYGGSSVRHLEIKIRLYKDDYNMAAF
jgi:hypothetical protein